MVTLEYLCRRCRNRFKHEVGRFRRGPEPGIIYHANSIQAGHLATHDCGYDGSLGVGDCIGWTAADDAVLAEQSDGEQRSEG